MNSSINNNSQINSVLLSFDKISKQIVSLEKSISSQPSIKAIHNDIDEKLEGVVTQLKRELKPQEKKDSSEEVKILKSKVDSIDKKTTQIPDYSDEIKNIFQKIKGIESRQEQVESLLGENLAIATYQF